MTWLDSRPSLDVTRRSASPLGVVSRPDAPISTFIWHLTLGEEMITMYEPATTLEWGPAHLREELPQLELGDERPDDN